MLATNVSAVLKTIAAQTASLPMADMEFSFLTVDPVNKGATPLPNRTARRAVHQPFPNIDPGLAGETEFSGDCGREYGSDGLKVGAGIEGA